MLFALSKIFWLLFSPVSLLVLAVLLGLLGLLIDRLFYRPWAWRWGRRLLLGGAFAFLAMTLLPLDILLLRPLEERFPQVTALPAGIDGVVVLGGALSPSGSQARGAPQINAAGERVFAMLELARKLPQTRVVFTGGSASIVSPDYREADEVKRLLRDLGVREERFLFERASRNTRENALYSHDLVLPKRTERWLLVTSAFHMPRAMGSFRALGWQVVAYPVDYQTPEGGGYLQFDPLGRLSRLQLAAKEWVGLAYYRLRGWSGRLFPAPLALGGG